MVGDREGAHPGARGEADHDETGIRPPDVVADVMAHPAAGKDIVRLRAELKAVNERLWVIEDDIRLKEKAQAFDEEFIRLAGVIRPIDIAPDNSLPSWKVADARITYSGKGALNDANAMGWLGRAFQSLLSPF